MYIHTRPFSHSVFCLFPFLSFVYEKTVNDLTALCSMAPKLILLKFFFVKLWMSRQNKTQNKAKDNSFETKMKHLKN